MTADGNVAKGGPQALSFYISHEMIHSDFNGDGKADILWRNTNGSAVVWLMDGTTRLAVGGIGGAPPAWQIEKIQDYNGDGKADILWRNTNGAVAIWLMDGFTRLDAQVIGGAPPAWQIQP